MALLWPYAAAFFIAILWVAFIVRLVRKQRAAVLPTALPDADARAAAAQALWDLYPAFPDEEPDTALLLLDESKYAYESWVETNARIEAKATWLTGFLAGGAGLLTVLGSIRGGNSGLPVGPFLALALLGAFGSLVSCLYVLRPKLRPHPTVNDYVAPAIAISPKARFHVALSLAEGYNQATLEIARLRRYDPIAWTAAQASLVVAVCAILIHLWITLTSSTSSTHVVRCRGQAAPYHAGTAWKSSCKEP